ncbi:MAG: RING finger domain-containing protein [Promethearchaeota archaeon]
MTGYKLNYCPYCGKKLRTSTEYQTNFCNYCGHKLKKTIPYMEKKVQCTICHDFIWLRRSKTIKCSFCGSEYHYSCVASWLMVHNSCPMCQNVFLNPTLIANSITKKK